jgi:signal transduction histidine kinase
MRLGFRSTFSRIIWLHVLALAATSLVMTGGIFVMLAKTVAGYQQHMMRQHEQALLQRLTPAGQGWSLSLPDAIRTLYAQGYGGFAFTILDGSGRVLFSSRAGGAPLADLPGARTAMTPFKSRTDRGGSYQGASFAERKAGRPIWIQVGQDMQDPDVVMDDVLDRFPAQVGALTISVLLLLLAADVLIVQRALTPVLRASSMAGAINPRRIDLRLPLDGMPLEILPLITAVNQALDRLEQGFRAQRDLTADVAHELRTPLTVLRMRIDALADQETGAALKTDIDLMSRIVSQLLAISELETVIIGLDDRADLAGVGLDVAEHLAPLAVSQGKQIALEGSGRPVWVRGQHDFLFQALRNLAENAIAHTPAGTTVRIEIDGDGKARVLDRGPGVAPDQRELLFKRFWRKRRDRGPVGAGAGLGLSIVARIAESHGGAVAVEDRAGGGAAFTLRIPLADPA